MQIDHLPELPLKPGRQGRQKLRLVQEGHDPHPVCGPAQRLLGLQEGQAGAQGPEQGGGKAEVRCQAKTWTALV